MVLGERYHFDWRKDSMNQFQGLDQCETITDLKEHLINEE